VSSARRALKRCNAMLERGLGVLLAGLTALMVLTVLWQVFTRLLSRAASSGGFALPIEPSRWTEELASFLLAWVALLGAAYALRRGEHVGYDALHGRLDAVGQRRLEYFVRGAVICFALVLVGGGIGIVRMTLELGQTTPALGWSMGWVYAVAPLSGALLTLFALERVGDAE
jgi:TRAP-type C4-dicarboxylate transport system permease small subunit